MALAELQSIADASSYRSEVLIVEDDATAALLLEAIITAMGHSATRASTGREAEALVDKNTFDLLLIDLGLPDVDGLEVSRRLRERWPAETLPIVFVSGERDPAKRVEGFGVGGADFITKPYDVAEVRARLSHQLETSRLRRQLELSAEVLEQQVEERTAELSRRMAELRGEIELRRRLEEELRQQADTDPLTGHLNQRGLPRVLDAWRRGSANGLIIATEIDGWESITGVLGHYDADRLLVAVGERIAAAGRGGPVGRLGASLFLSALVSSHEDETETLRSFRQVLEPPISVQNRSMRLTFTIGVVEDVASTSTTELLRDATLALHVAKQQPGDTVVLRAEQRAELADDLRLEQELWGAAERGELILQYQPIFATETLERVGFEALMRWLHPERGLVAPGRFIPIAERSGAIGELGKWTLREATRQLGEWRDRGTVGLDVSMAVNVSAVEAIDLDLPARVQQALCLAGLGSDALHLELTETALLRRGPVLSQVLEELKNAGVSICLDDFGTGSSSLTLLQRTPADVVKIDRSFVSEIGDDGASRAIVESTIELAHRLGKRVVGEGVETVEQLELLRDLGCDQVQGYLLSRPMDASDACAIGIADVRPETMEIYVEP